MVAAKTPQPTKKRKPHRKTEITVSELTVEDLDKLMSLLPSMPQEQQEVILDELTKYEELLTKERTQTKFLDFVEAMWPDFIMGRHHKIMADAFERVAEGKCKRLIVNMPPRHTKSEFA